MPYNLVHSEEHDDDQPVGRVVTRRQALKLFAAPSLLWIAGCSLADEAAGEDAPLVGSCVARPELTEGPFYVSKNLNRSDIRADSETGAVRAGALLALTFTVSRIEGNTCSLLENALVDVWHTDALGNYSDVGSLRGQDFLRGYQITGADGVARFTTVYPGWYRGRAVHIHFKVRSSASSTSAYEFTSQLFFQDEFTDQIYQQAPYNTRGTRNTRNSNDGIYGQSGGQTLVAAAATEQGYAAMFDIALYID